MSARAATPTAVPEPEGAPLAQPAPASESTAAEVTTAATRAHAERFKAGDITLAELVGTLANSEFEVCRWGSCQYATAQAVFDALRALQQAGLDPTATVGLPSLADLLARDVNVRDLRARLFATVVAREREYEGENLRASDIEPYLPILPILADGEDGEATLDSVFITLRLRAWDLWTAAESFGSRLFDGRTLPSPPGVGPPGNRLAQSRNGATGLYCFLLMESGLVHNEAVFHGFDT